MSIASGKQLLLLGVLVVCVSVALADPVFNDIVMPMSSTTMANVRSQLLSYVNQRQIAAPQSVFCNNCLISGWQRHNKNRNFFTFMLKDLNESIKNYPEQVRNRLKALAHASSNTFENFKVTIERTHVVKIAYVGAARRIGDLVEVGMLDVDIRATLVQKYNAVEVRKCDFWRCWTETHHEPRGYHASEINSMTTYLEYEAFKMFKQILDSM